MINYLNLILAIVAGFCFIKTVTNYKSGNSIIAAFFFIFTALQHCWASFDLNIGNIYNYINFIIQTASIVFLQLLIYRMFITEKIDFKDSMDRTISYSDDVKKLELKVYKYLIVESFLQFTAIGLISYFEFERYIFISTFSLTILALAFVFLFKLFFISRKYSKSFMYLKYTIFVFCYIILNIVNSIIKYYSYYLDQSVLDYCYLIYYIFISIQIIILFSFLFRGGKQ